jgi:hypothetical protein
MDQSNDEPEFYPKGAIAFFVVMIIIFALMWFSIYFEVLGRG